MATIKRHEYYDLGQHRRSIITKNVATQIWFDRGLNWVFGFNHEEAVECFERAIALDPTCAMAYWGLSYAAGPNYNRPWGAFADGELHVTLKRAHGAARAALTMAQNASQVEVALIEAIQHRYPQDAPSDGCAAWDRSFSEAMRTVYLAHSDDFDVVTIFADSLMNLTPWRLWDLRTGSPPLGAYTLEIKDVLESALSKPSALVHPGLLHMYIHLMEMSPNPEAALFAADGLRNLMPDSGHLNHMPSHIDILLGDYRAAIQANENAIRADNIYLAQVGAANFYTAYRVHNHHFRLYAAMFSGQWQIALDAVNALEEALPESLLRIGSPPMASWLESFCGMRLHAYVRFGRWHDILDIQPPSDPKLYCVTTAMTYYARAMAAANLRDLSMADAAVEHFGLAKQRVPNSRTLFNNKCTDILEVAEQLLHSEIEYRRGEIEVAFHHLRHAIDLEDALPYDEPWGWMQPTRHAYGALLLEQSRIEEALHVYKADLGIDSSLPRARQHPRNVWALHGYHECLSRLNRIQDDSAITSQLDDALRVADVSISSSCYCRRLEQPQKPWPTNSSKSYL